MPKGTVTVRVIGDSRGLKKTLDESGAKLKAFGSRVESAGRSLTLGLTTPLVAGGVAAFKFASDLNEATSKVQVVFGKSAKVIEKWAEDSAKAFGLSKAEALDSVGTIGNLFTALKLPERQAVTMSKAIVELAGDLASFNNVSVDEAMTALRSGLVGETEPLKRFGVNLNDASLKEKALALGLIKTTKGVLPPAIKAQAAYALIVEQTKKAQGDYARTADGAANKQRTLVAQFKNTAAVLGAQLLPIGKKLLDFASNLLTRFEKLNPNIQGFVLKGAAVAAALGPALIVVGKFASLLGTLPAILAAITGPVGLVVAAIALIVAGFIAAWRSSEEFRNRIREIVEKVKGFVAGLVERFRAMAPFFKSVWESMLKTGKTVVNAIAKLIKKLVDDWGPFFQKVLPIIARVLGEAFKIAGAIIRTLTPIVAGQITVISTLFKTMITLVSRIVNAVIHAINAVIRGINLIKPGKDIGTIKTIDVNALFAPSRTKVEQQRLAPESKLKQFHSGGRVPGRPGEEVPILAKAGEVVSTEREAGATTIVNVYPQALLGTKRELVAWIREALNQTGRNNVSVGLG